MNVAMGTFCLATPTAWQLAKLLLWHSCQSTYAGIGVRLALHDGRIYLAVEMCVCVFVCVMVMSGKKT